MKFKNESDRWLVITALQAMASRWKEDAEVPELGPLQQQFADQVAAAERIARQIEEED